MRTLPSLFAVLAVFALGAGQASAREVDSRGEANTSLASSPARSSMQPRVKKDATVPTKYDVSYPVRDYGRMQRENTSI